MPPLWPKIATGPRFEFADAPVRQGHEIRWRGEVAEAIGARDCDARLRDRSGEFFAQPAAFLVAAFAKAAGEDRGAARACAARVADRVDYRAAGHEDHDVIGRLGQRGEVLVAALAAPHRFVARIDGIDRPLEADARQRIVDGDRPAARPVARADDGHVARRQQRGDAAGSLVFLVHRASVSMCCVMRAAGRRCALRRDRR